MSRPTYQVLVFFGESTTASSSFILDDPVQGLLDSAYTLGGDVGSDISADAFLIDVQRGKRSLIFDEFDAGKCTVSLNNEDRSYDPLYVAGPHYSDLTPGKRVRVLADGVPVFDGRIADWNLTYSTSGRSVATFVAEDPLAVLARQQFDAWTATASQTAGPRLTAVLNRSEVAWPGGQRDLDTGTTTLQGDSVSWGSSVLNYCQLVAKSEFGSFFASRDGLLTLRDRYANLTGSPVVAFADDGTGVAFQAVEVQVGSETFYTRVSVTREGGTAQTYTMASAADDGVVSLALSGLLMDSDTQAYDMASYLANVYATGEARVSSVTTAIDDQLLTTAEIAALLAVEINDLVSVTWTPNGVGDPIEQTCVVIGVDHHISTERHDVRLTLGKYDNRAPFILDSATNGVLDGTSVLVF